MTVARDDRRRRARGRGGACRAGLAAAALAVMLAGGATAQALRDHDTNQPIEITSDELEVLQRQHVATFSGDVDAVQGQLVLSADALKVFYRDGGASAGATGDAAAIRRIEATGNVFLASPSETAQGDAGVYDVVARKVTLEGQVMLQRQDNVIKGDRMELDLVSGRSQIFAAVAADAGGSPDNRVRAIFVPEEEGGAASATGAPAAGAQATAAPAGPADWPPLPQFKPGRGG